MDVANVAILGEAATAGAAVVMRCAAREDVGIVIARRTHLEAVAVALCERTVVVRLATRNSDGSTCLPEIVTVVGVLMRIAIDEFISRACPELAGKTIGVLARRGGIHIAFALAILNRVVRCACSLNLNARVLVTGGDAGVDDATGFSVDVNAWMIDAGDSETVESDVIAGDKSVCGVIEVEGGRAGDRYACGDVAGTIHAVGARYIDCLSRLGGLNCVNDIGAGRRGDNEDSQRCADDMFGTCVHDVALLVVVVFGLLCIWPTPPCVRGSDYP